MRRRETKVAVVDFDTAVTLVVPGGAKMRCANLQDAVRVVRSYSSGLGPNDMGSSEFYETKDVGLVTVNGVPMARISYNGRIWHPFEAGCEISLSMPTPEVSP